MRMRNTENTSHFRVKVQLLLCFCHMVKIHIHFAKNWKEIWLMSPLALSLLKSVTGYQSVSGAETLYL